MSPSQRAQDPKISAAAEKRARTRREQLVRQDAASAQKSAEVAAQAAAAIAVRLGLQQGRTEELPKELAKLVKQNLKAEAPPSAEHLAAGKGTQG